MRKKGVKLILTLLVIIILAVGGLIFWQYDNITAVLNSMTKSSEELSVQLDENREKLKTEVEKYTDKPIMDLTAEDEQKLLKGEISLKDISEKYNLPMDVMEDKAEGANQGTNATDNTDNSSINSGSKVTDEMPNKDTEDTSAQDDGVKDNKEKIDDAISGSVSKMYALKAKYVNKLGELEREVIKEYTALPKEEQNKKSKEKLVMANIDYVAELEKKCDGEVDAVLNNLEKQLKELSGDIEIIDILKKAYDDEKKVKKSYYLSLYNK